MFPTSQIHIEKVREVFDKYDADQDGAIGLNELAEMFQKISNRLTALPAVSGIPIDSERAYPQLTEYNCFFELLPTDRTSS